MDECANCKGERWVCENHPDVMWDGDQKCCGGAGMPCGVCNVTGPGVFPAMPPNFIARASSLSEGETIQ